jgi:hypothetical protein
LSNISKPIPLTIAALALIFIASSCQQARARASAAPTSSVTANPVAVKESSHEVATLPAHVVMHNVILHENDLKMRVRWLRGDLVRTNSNVIPSFDEPTSFALNIQEAAASISLADLATSLNSNFLKGSALHDVKLSQDGNHLKLNGTLEKGVPLPVEVKSDVDAAPDGRVHIHIAKIRVLKLPVKTLMKILEIKTADMIDPKGGKGLEVKGDDIYIDPEQILPAPRKRGKLTAVQLNSGSLVEFYGKPRNDIVKTSQWRNFISVRGGAIAMGKLTMNYADIVMIDTSPGDWFDFDLSNYQRQLANGYIRMTPQAGLRVFLPDYSRVAANAANAAIRLEWMKNRNLPPPDDLP